MRRYHILRPAAPLKAFKDMVELVFTAGYPFTTFLATPVHRVQLRTIAGRRRSYPCWPSALWRQSEGAPRASPSSRSSSRSSQSGNGSPGRSPGRPKSPVRDSRITKWPLKTRKQTGADGRTQIVRAGLPFTEPQGLHNPGNYCYRNALLQSLVHVPAVYNELQEIHPVEDCALPIDECIACAFKDLVFQYWNDRSPKTFPRDEDGGVPATLNEAVNRCAPDKAFHQFATPYVQGDAFELFGHVIGEMKENDEKSSPALDRLFSITHEIHRKCTSCKTQSPSREVTEIGLSLAVKKNARWSLMDHLEEFHGDLIEGAACESEECVQMRQRDEQLGSPGSHPQQEQTYTITEAPSTLVINLKRGQFDKRSFQSYKLKDDVPFDEELDLSRFTAGNTALKYRLYGVIAHSGPQPNYGHWIAVVRHRNGTEYRTISDSRIRRGHPADDFEEMEYPAWGTDADGKAELFEPTVLVYQKIQED